MVIDVAPEVRADPVPFGLNRPFQTPLGDTGGRGFSRTAPYVDQRHKSSETSPIMQDNRANEWIESVKTIDFSPAEGEINQKNAQANPIFGPGSRLFAYFSDGNPLRLHSAYEPSKSLTS
jgi:hypothetical protein